MTMAAIDKATRRLIDWALSSEWAPLLSQVYMDHIGAIAETFEGDENELLELLGDAAGMLKAFVVEDFFTATVRGSAENWNVVDDLPRGSGWQRRVGHGAALPRILAGFDSRRCMRWSALIWAHLTVRDSASCRARQ